MNCFKSRSTHLLVAGTLAAGFLTLTGCGLGSAAGGTDTVAARMKGNLHGGPNPISGATITVYATGDSTGTSTGYGVGTALQSTTTDVNGNFSFAGGYTCPAGQFAYVTAAGGNTGGNTPNPNSLLMAAIGPCESTSSSTFILMNELTTVAAGYALSNFMTITGDAKNGYVVGVGAPATNNAKAGCVNNSYYGSANCPMTASAGLKHAFQNAEMLVDYASGVPAQTTANGALVPTALINTLGNILQACVNSGGGGTDATGATTTTIGANGTGHDGTPCGKLFAFTSYTNDGTSATMLHAAGNTLQAVQNLAKRPTGSASNFNSTCDSNSGSGTTSSVTCLFNLGTPVGLYQTSMTAAPPDWMMGIAYPKGSFGGAGTSTNCNGTAIMSTSLLYPIMLATDADDNIVVLNSDSSKNYCYNVITLSNSGTPIGSSAIENFSTGTASLGLSWISTDAFGHAIVPAGNSNVVNIYAAGANDSTILPAASFTIGTSSLWYSAVENNGDIYMTGGDSGTYSSSFQMLAAGMQSHNAPTYTASQVTGTAIASRLFQISADPHGTLWFTNSSSSTVAPYSYVPGASAWYKQNTGGCSSNGSGSSADSNGNFYMVLQDPTPSCSSTVINPTDIKKYTYNPTTPPTSGGLSQTQVAQLTPATKSQSSVAIDGNNTLWWAYGTGTTSTTPITTAFLRGYDTANNYPYPQLFGCKFQSGQTQCGAVSSNSNTPYLAYGTQGVAIDSAGSMWLANSSSGNLAEIIGMAAPTLPLFIHNGVSNKP